jgi:hypothetical protein
MAVYTAIKYLLDVGTRKAGGKPIAGLGFDY